MGPSICKAVVFPVFGSSNVESFLFSKYLDGADVNLFIFEAIFSFVSAVPSPPPPSSSFSFFFCVCACACVVGAYSHRCMRHAVAYVHVEARAPSLCLAQELSAFCLETGCLLWSSLVRFI